jgi:photosystem II stability/assembly factor-like uncharacterized protein
MTTLFSLSLLLILLQVAWSDEFIWTQTSAPPKQWRSIASDSTGQYLAALVYNKTSVYTSNDYGSTWIANSVSGSGSSFEAIASDSTGQYLVAGERNIYTSSNYGLNWTLTSAPSTNYGWESVASDSTGQYLAAGQYSGGIFTSSNYGSSWLKSSALNGFWASIASDSTGQYLAAVQLSTGIYTSDSYGSSWVLTSAPFVTSGQGWESIASDSSGQYLAAVVYKGFIFTSRNYGSTWTNTSAPYGTWDSIASDSTGQYLAAVQSSGYIYTSSNNGSTWIRQISAPSLGWFSIASDSTGERLVAGPANYPIYTAVSVSSPTSQPSSNSSRQPTYQQTSLPTRQPTRQPTYQQTVQPTVQPAVQPTHQPTVQPTVQPTRQPTVQPTSMPSSIPSSVPSSEPTTIPTSVPTCSIGEMHDSTGVGCFLCNPGEYISELGGSCEPCPKNTFSTQPGSTYCDDCPYPTATAFDGQTRCTVYNFTISLAFTLTVLLSSFAFFVVCICCTDNRFVVLINLLFPTLDVFTDVAYLMTNDFYSYSLFLCAVVFVLYPLPMFVKTLMERSAYPHLWWSLDGIWWLSCDRDGDRIYFVKFPCFGETGRFPLLSCKMHHTLFALFLEGVVWVIAIVCQLLTLIIWPLMLPVNILLLFLWFCVGVFLHMTKTITVGRVWSAWFRIWTNTDEHYTEIDVDTEELNKCLQEEFYLETIPQVALQMVNNLLLKQFSPLAIFSLVFSFVMALNGCWKFVYFRYCVDNRLELAEIPIEMSVKVNIPFLGIDWRLFEAKLEPKTKNTNHVSQKKFVPNDQFIRATSSVSSNVELAQPNPLHQDPDTSSPVSPNDNQLSSPFSSSKSSSFLLP